MLGGHFDSWQGGTGATDNGTGQRSHARRDAPTHPNPGPRPRCEEPRIERDVGSSYSEERGKEICSMAKLVYGLNQSLDGYVDHMKLGPPVPVAFRHFIELVRGLTGVIDGRRMYEIMRYWDEDLPDWDAEDRDFAVAWRSQPKWVVSRSLKSVGPHATLVADDFEKE